MDFSFDPASHIYTRNGRQVPATTRILDHAGLVSYDLVRSEILERKSRIGTAVHAATHFYDTDDLDWSSIMDDDEICNRVRAWISFRKDTGFVPRRIEEQFVATVHGMEYGLTVDREGILGRNECIVELKTSAAVQPFWAIQLAGYALGLPERPPQPTENHGPSLVSPSARALFARRRRVAVQLLPDARYKMWPFDDYFDAEVFMAALCITHWKLQHNAPIRRIEE